MGPSITIAIPFETEWALWRASYSRAGQKTAMDFRRPCTNRLFRVPPLTPSERFDSVGAHG
jgi:hypothetical protein